MPGSVSAAVSGEPVPPPASEVFVYPENTRPMVWIMQGKTDHAAYILKEHNGRKFVRWAVSQLTQWIEPSVEIKTELPRRRKGRRDDLNPDYVFSSTAVVSREKNGKTEAPLRKVKTTKKASKAASNISSLGGKKRAKSPVKGTKMSAASKKRKSSAANQKGKGKYNCKYPLGTQVYKEFPPFGWFIGEVVGMTDDNQYHIVYEDEDEETMDTSEVDRYLVGNESSLEMMESAAEALQDSHPLKESASNSVDTIEQAAGENTASETSLSLRKSPRHESKLASKRASDNRGANHPIVEQSTTSIRPAAPGIASEGSVVAQPQIRPTAKCLPRKSTTVKGSKQQSSNSKHQPLPSFSSSHQDSEKNAGTAEKTRGGTLSKRPSSPLRVEEDTNKRQRLKETNYTAKSNTRLPRENKYPLAGKSQIASTQKAATKETQQLPDSTSVKTKARVAAQGKLHQTSAVKSSSNINAQSLANVGSHAVKPAAVSTKEPTSRNDNIGDPISIVAPSSNEKNKNSKKQSPVLPPDNSQLNTEALAEEEKAPSKPSPSDLSNIQITKTTPEVCADKSEATEASFRGEKASLQESTSKDPNDETVKETPNSAVGMSEKGYLRTGAKTDKPAKAKQSVSVTKTSIQNANSSEVSLTSNEQQAKATVPVPVEATRHSSVEKTDTQKFNSSQGPCSTKEQQTIAKDPLEVTQHSSVEKAETQKVAPKPTQGSHSNNKQRAKTTGADPYSGAEPPRKVTTTASWAATSKFPKAFFKNALASKLAGESPLNTKLASPTDGKQPPSGKKSKVTGNEITRLNNGMSKAVKVTATHKTKTAMNTSATFEKEPPSSEGKSGSEEPHASLERSKKPKFADHFPSGVDAEKLDRERTSAGDGTSSTDSLAFAGSKINDRTLSTSDTLDKQRNADNPPTTSVSLESQRKKSENENESISDKELSPNPHKADKAKDVSENQVDAAEPDERENRTVTEEPAKRLLTTTSSLAVSDMINAHLSADEKFAAADKVEVEAFTIANSDTFTVAVLGTVSTSISAGAHLVGANDSENKGVEAMGKASNSIQSDYSEPSLISVGAADHGERGEHQKARGLPTTVALNPAVSNPTKGNEVCPARPRSKRLMEKFSASREATDCTDVRAMLLTKSGSASLNASPKIDSSDESHAVEHKIQSNQGGATSRISSAGGKKRPADKEELLGLAETLAGLPSSMPADTNELGNSSSAESTLRSHTSNKVSASVGQADGEVTSDKDHNEASARKDTSQQPGKQSTKAPATSTPAQPMTNYGLSEGTRCPVCSNHIEALAYSPVDWSRPLQYPQYEFAIDAIVKHTEECHKEEPIWNIMEAQLGMEEHKKSVEEHKRATENPQSPPKNLLSPENFCRMALRHAIGCSFAIDDSLQDMTKLRDMFVRRMGIARGFIQWSSDYFLYGRTCINCTGDVVPGYEMRRSALLLMAYLEDHIMEFAFEKNSHVTEGYALTYPVSKWRNMVQNVFLDPKGIEKAWFVEDHDRPSRSQYN